MLLSFCRNVWIMWFYENMTASMEKAAKCHCIHCGNWQRISLSSAIWIFKAARIMIIEYVNYSFFCWFASGFLSWTIHSVEVFVVQKYMYETMTNNNEKYTLWLILWNWHLEWVGASNAITIYRYIYKIWMYVRPKVKLDSPQLV